MEAKVKHCCFEMNAMCSDEFLEDEFDEPFITAHPKGFNGIGDKVEYIFTERFLGFKFCPWCGTNLKENENVQELRPNIVL